MVLSRSLSDAIVIHEHVALDLAECFVLYLHLVPGALLHSLTQKLKLESGLLSLLADLIAYLLAFLIDMLSALNINDEIVALKFLDFRHLLILSEDIVKFLADGFKLNLDLFSEALTAGSLLAMEGFLEDLAVGADFGLRNIVDLLNLIDGLNIHAI